MGAGDVTGTLKLASAAS